MSRWKKISLAALVVILLAIGALGFLAGTTTGLHLLFNAANRWIPGLNIGQVDGGWRNLTLRDLRYERSGIAVRVGKAHLAVQLNCLWHSRLCVNDFSLKDVDVAVDTKKMPPSAPARDRDSGPLDLSTPYPVTFSRVTLDNLNLRIDDTTVSVMDFSSGLHWAQRNLTLTPTTLEGVLIALPKAADVAKEKVIQPKIVDPEPKAVSLGEMLKKGFAQPLLPEMTGVNLPVNLNIQSIHGAHLRLTGDTDLMVNSLLLKVSSNDGNLTLDALNVDASQGSVNASGSAQLRGNWPVNLTLNSTLNIDPLKGEKVKMTVAGALRDELKIGVNLSGPVGGRLNAQTRLAEAGLPLDVEVVSKQLYWPLTGARQYQAVDLRLRLTGKMTDYKLAFTTAVKGDRIPPATITLDGKGNAQQFMLDKLRVAALQGHTDLSALVDWSKAISWRGELTLAGINTAKQFPDWPAKLDGGIKMRGSFYGGGWQLEIPGIKLGGNVKQNKVDVRGSLRGNDSLQWKVPGLHLALGRNTVDVKGELGEKALNLDAEINAPDLDNTLPGLGGTVKGMIKVRGDVKAPQLSAFLTANGLRWQALRVARVLLKGEVKSTDQIAGNLNLRAESVTQPGVNVDLVTLEVKGDEKQHQLQLRIQGEPVSGRLNLSGSFDRSEERWRGKLSHTRFDTPVGPWTLNRDLTLDLRSKEQKMAIGPHCWVNPNAELCVPQTIDAGAKGRAVVNLNRFDLAMLKPVMPADTQASGVFSGKADVSWDSEGGGLPQGQVTLSGRGVEVTQRVDGNTLPVAFDTLELNAGLKNNRARLGWLVKVANNGQFDGQIQIADPQGRRDLGGYVNIHNFSLAIVNALFSKGEKAAGTLNVSLRPAGNLQRPQLFGQMQLDGVNVVGNFMPFEMQPSEIAMNFNGMNSTLQGVVRTKQGQIVLSGDADWRQIDNWRARIAAQGSKVRMTVPPMVRLDVSPDIEFVATPGLFTLNGNVDVPWARIVVHDVPDSAVGVSSDEVMLDRDLKPINPQSASIPVNSNLTIHVGNNVRLDAFGLKARLTGDLKMVQDKQGLGLNGQITIPQGRFRAYGQDLIVRKGELLFSGPPDNPYLNIEAIRNPDSTENNVTAGVRVTGLADEPKAEIFSDPAMSQQEVLSYLLRGQGLDNSGNNGDAMTSMLVGLGVAQSGQVVGKIGETFGVSNLVLDTAGVGDASQVVVSGYILPGLQVKYGVGIFDSLATLTLRYRLMPRLYLEAVSGLDQALDLLYQFEF